MLGVLAICVTSSTKHLQSSSRFNYFAAVHSARETAYATSVDCQLIVLLERSAVCPFIMFFRGRSAHLLITRTVISTSTVTLTFFLSIFIKFFSIGFVSSFDFGVAFNQSHFSRCWSTRKRIIGLLRRKKKTRRWKTWIVERLNGSASRSREIGSERSITAATRLSFMTPWRLLKLLMPANNHRSISSIGFHLHPSMCYPLSLRHNRHFHVAFSCPRKHSQSIPLQSISSRLNESLVNSSSIQNGAWVGDIALFMTQCVESILIEWRD